MYNTEGEKKIDKEIKKVINIRDKKIVGVDNISNDPLMIKKNSWS